MRGNQAGVEHDSSWLVKAGLSPAPLCLAVRHQVAAFRLVDEGHEAAAVQGVCPGASDKPVSLQARDRLVRIYNQMPEPKFVVAVGSCGISGGVFQGCYNVVGDISEVIPVNVYIPGCPPRPEAIIHGVVELLKSLQN